MKTLTPQQLEKLKGAMCGGPTGKVVEQDGTTYVEMRKTPWTALEPFFPEGWTKDEVREALTHELITKPFHAEIQRRLLEAPFPRWLYDFHRL